MIAGRLKRFQHKWKEITSDLTILSWVEGYEITFTSKVVENLIRSEPHWSKQEISLISSRIEELLQKGVINSCEPTEGQLFRKNFLTPKPDGSYRLILNLKKLNVFTETKHFKLEDWKVVRKIVSHNCFMATLDLKDAYYLIPIAEKDKKYLSFIFSGQHYEFNCLPFGLNTAPWVFTKLLKPVIVHLREAGCSSVIYFDDILLIGNSQVNFKSNVKVTCTLLNSLGFIINAEKSKHVPPLHCSYLGLELYSESMTIQLPRDKTDRILKLILKVSRKKSCKIREFAFLIGSSDLCCQATKYGWAQLKDF